MPTLLKINSRRSPQRSAVFTCQFRGRGAADWQTIVDDFDRYVSDAASELKTKVVKPDGLQTLGRGARVEMPVAVFLRAFLKWSRSPPVLAADTAGSLRAECSNRPPRSIEDCRSLWLDRVEPEVAVEEEGAG